MAVRRATAIRESAGDRAFLIGVYVLLGLIFIAIAYPLIFIVSSSFSSYTAVRAGRVWLWPVDPSLAGYQFVFRDPDIVTGYLNSAFYTVGGTALSVTLTIMMAYPLSLKDFWGRRLIIWALIFAFIFNGGLIPFYLVVKDLGMIDTRWAMIVPSALGIFQVMLAKTFFQSTIPTELYEAAQLDGCGDVRFLLSVVVPLSKPIIAVLVLLYAIGQWNSYFNALIFLNSDSLYPLQLVLRSILILGQSQATQQAISPEQLQIFEQISTLTKYSLIVVASVPVLLLYPLAQKYFVKGVMLGSLKE
ncbi:MAG TPA: carbohydrate ABC transporter permease [Chloroflexota bacterium]|nr:carbohydrate ABC transporter permease [Chloroflexota bacterium]